MEGFLRRDLEAYRGVRPDMLDSTADPDTPVSRAAANLLHQTLQPVFGPFLRFNSWDINTSLWTGSVLIVAHQSVTSRPFLNFSSQACGKQFSEGLLLDSFGQYSFWKFPLGTTLGQQPTVLQYSVDYGQGASISPTNDFTVHLPSRDQPWHWAFHSCSGFSLSVNQPEWGGIAPLWNDLLEQHRASPIHLVVGGGDQLYNDALFKLPTTKNWLAIKDAKQRDLAPFTQEMAAEVYEYYFRNYAVHFSAEAMSTAFATIPQTMTWDDHDIFDGWGSYPDTIQNCPVFQGCFQAAKRFYLLFQQHTTAERAYRETDLFGHRGNSMIKQCGPKLALLIPDARAERTKSQVIDPQSWDMMFERLRALPPSTRHVVMVTTVPVVYPQIPGSEKILETVSGADRGNKIASLFKKTGLTKAAMSSFGEPELLDDLVDHWNAGNHKEERKYLVEECQKVAAAQSIRFSFLSGDVHVCAAGRLYSDPKVNLANDHRYMPQIVSSAIVNAPPPEGVIKTLHLCSTAHKNVDKQTKEKMIRVFKNEKDLGDKLAGRRNWCEVWEAATSIPARNMPLPEYQIAAQGSLVFTLRLEMDKHKPGVCKPFDIPIVPLLTQAGGAFSNTHPLNSGNAASVAALSSGMGGLSVNPNGQQNQAGQYGVYNQNQPDQSQVGHNGGYSQPSQAGYGQGGYSQPTQGGQGGNPQANQAAAGYSTGDNSQPGGYTQGNGSYGQSNQSAGAGYPAPNRHDTQQYGQPNQSQNPNPDGNQLYGQPGSGTPYSQHNPGQTAGAQSSGGFATYPEHSHDGQTNTGNQQYGSPGTAGNMQSGYSQGMTGQQQQPYTQSGNSNDDNSSSNAVNYPPIAGAGGYSQGPDASSNNHSGSGQYGQYGQGPNRGGYNQTNQGVQGGYSQPDQTGYPQANQGGQFGQSGGAGPGWPSAPQWTPQGAAGNAPGNTNYQSNQYGIPPQL